MLNCSFCNREKSDEVKLIQDTNSESKCAICFRCTIICKKLIEKYKTTKYKVIKFEENNK